jgi:hypothetical protein
VRVSDIYFDISFAVSKKDCIFAIETFQKLQDFK